MNASIKSIGPEPPHLTRNYKKRSKPVDGYGKYIKVLDTVYKPPRTYSFPKPDKGRTERIQESCRQYRKKNLPPSVWTDERVAELKELFGHGKTHAEIADEMHLSVNQVRAQVHKLQDEGELECRISPRAFTDKEVETLIKLRRQGMSFVAIGKKLGRMEGTCSRKYREVMRNGKNL